MANPKATSKSTEPSSPQAPAISPAGASVSAQAALPQGVDLKKRMPVTDPPKRIASDAERVARVMRLLGDYLRGPKALTPEQLNTVRSILALFPAS